MTSRQRWQFYIDRGGTFTDIVAKTPQDEIIVYKLLSENPEQYQDAPIQGIRDLMGISQDEATPTAEIEMVKMGTTVATNALLERKGDKVVLLITKGFKDALRIGYQNRPNIFAREIVLPSMLYESVVEIDERYDANGNELKPVDKLQVKQDLEAVYNRGIKCCAIVLIHGYRYTKHELEVGAIAQEIGFTQISISHQVSPLMKLVSRGDTTVVDAYLTPILRRYVDRLSSKLPNIPLMFMKSDGGLVSANNFQGKDSILSGPAGAQVACLVADTLGISKIFIHPYGGVLSAYGIGLADISTTKVESVEMTLNSDFMPQLESLFTSLVKELSKQQESNNQGLIINKVNLKYEGSNSTLTVDFDADLALMQQNFAIAHQTRYGFIQVEKELIIESISVELIQQMNTPEERIINRTRLINTPPRSIEIVEMFALDQWYQAPVYRREDLQPEDCITGAAIIVEKISTIIIEPNWQAIVSDRNYLVLERINIVSEINR